ncbi:MAG: hypothetical protein H7Z14_05145, partial [Anaerolineae bacterium]|nr:hypothetical protein [Phycisphaerae bacterium]
MKNGVGIARDAELSDAITNLRENSAPAAGRWAEVVHVMPLLNIPTLLVRLVFLAVLFAPLPMAHAQTPTTAPAAPTSQPVAAERSRETLLNVLERTKLGQVFSGERSLTLDDVRNPIFWYDTFRDLIVAVLLFIPRFVGTIVFLFVFWLIYRGIRKVIVRSMKKEEVDQSIRDLLATLIKWVVMGFGIVIACNQLGIPIVAMLTGVSIIG